MDEIVKASRESAIALVKLNGGMVYFPETCNIQSNLIGARAKIHSHVWIGDRVEIGDDVIIQAFCFIPNGVTIGHRVFLGPRVTFTNDKHPPSKHWDKTQVGDKVSIGAGAVILPGITIGYGAVVGAGAVVTKDVPPRATVVGNPARVVPLRSMQEIDGRLPLHHN